MKTITKKKSFTKSPEEEEWIPKMSKESSKSFWILSQKALEKEIVLSLETLESLKLFVKAPRTSIIIPARNAVKFTPGKKLKRLVSE